MIGAFGQGLSNGLMNSRRNVENRSVYTTNTSQTPPWLDPNTTDQQVGISPGKVWQTQPQGSFAPVGDVLTLIKTGDGEFVLSGANAQRLLMEYFEQAPELWLRLMAVKAEEEENG